MTPTTPCYHWSRTGSITATRWCHLQCTCTSVGFFSSAVALKDSVTLPSRGRALFGLLSRIHVWGRATEAYAWNRGRSVTLVLNGL